MEKLQHEVHTSERKSFRGCRRRWEWHFVDQWTPIGMAKPLEFGIAYHKGKEVLYDPETWDWDREVVGELAVKKFVDSCNEQRKKYLEAVNEPDLQAEAQADYDERIELGKGMLRYFYREQLPKYPENFRPVKVEIGFEVPILHPDTGEQLYCKCNSCWQRWEAWALENDPQYEDTLAYDAASNFRKLYWEGLPVVFAGRIDCLGEDENGDYWVVDWKTARSISTDDEFLELDDQIGSYVWALKTLGLPVRGFYYHEQKKGFPQPPLENKVIRKGCRFSVNKQQDTDYETYLATVQAHDPHAYEAGAYDEILLFLKMEGIKFHYRWQIVKSDKQLEAIAYNIGLEALDMIDPNVRIYPNSGRFSCKFCAFRQPCLGKNAGEDYEYTLQTLFRKEPPYYYRQQQGPSTESRGGE